MSLANNPKIAITEMPDCAGNLRSAAMLEEYKTLRQEILNQQQNSHQITLLGLTIGGAIVSFIGLGRDAAAPSLTKAVLLFAVVLIFYSLVYAQVYRRRKMNRIGRYIEFVIETQIPGLCWETAWCRKKDTDAADAPSVFETLPLLTLQVMAMIGSVYYLQDALPVLFAPPPTHLAQFGHMARWLLLLAGVLAYVAIGLHERGLIGNANEVASHEEVFWDKRLNFRQLKKVNQTIFSGCGDKAKMGEIEEDLCQDDQLA